MNVNAHDLDKLKGEIAELYKRFDADELSLTILQANITLAVDQIKTVVLGSEMSLARLMDLEKQSKDSVHRQSSLRTALNTVLDYLDKVEATGAAKGTS